MSNDRALRACAVRALLLTSLTLGTSLAWAQEEPSAADLAAARSLGQEGMQLAEQGNCADAVDRLQRSEKLVHAPTALAKLGECQVRLGRVVEGTENLNKVVRETLPPNAPQVFVQAQERAKVLLAAARPKIARLKIAVAAPPAAQISLKVDNEAMPLANLNSNRPMDPGDHVVEATAPGYKTASAKVHLDEGGIDSIALTLEVDPNAPKPAAPVNVVAEQPTEQPRSKVPAFVALGVGVVGVGLGTVFGLTVVSKEGDLSKACPSKTTCGADQQSTIDSAKTNGAVSTVSFVVGGLGLAVGTYLFFAPGKSSTSTTAAAPSVKPYVGLDRLGVTGTF